MVAPARSSYPVNWRIRGRADGYVMTICKAGRYLGAFLFAVILLSLPLAAQTAGAGPAAKQQDAPPPKVHELLDILADPAVQTWLARQRAGAAASAEPASEEGTVASHFAGRVAAIRQHLAALAAAVPQLRGE